MIHLIHLLACHPEATPPAVRRDDPCFSLKFPAPGPLAAERTKAGDDARTVTELFVREARLTGDAGYYTQAEQALGCALARRPDDAELLRLQAHLSIQFHRFAEAEAQALALTARADAGWLDHALLGDAHMEQGELDAAADAYQRAVDLRPGLPVYDRVGWLRWLTGDIDGAVELAAMAAGAGSPLDPEPLAWALTRLGWLKVLQGAPAPELDQALTLLPDYPPARFYRGRVRLHAGDAGAADDLRAAGATVEAVWALSELDATASVEAVRGQDPRGYAIWLTPKDPVAALAILDEEWKIRQDATTRMARAWAASRITAVSDVSSWGGGEAPPQRPPSLDWASEARAALATGIAEPRVLRMGALVLGDDTLWQRALASGPGLLPSERLR